MLLGAMLGPGDTMVSQVKTLSLHGAAHSLLGDVASMRQLQGEGGKSSVLWEHRAGSLIPAPQQCQKNSCPLRLRTVTPGRLG